METINRLLSFVPDSLLEELSVNSGVDKYTKKLEGQLVFKLLLYCILTKKSTSLRGMQSALESAVFRALAAGNSVESVSFSSISDRLSTIKTVFFEALFKSTVASYGNSLAKYQDHVIRFDSTIVSLSGKLLKAGYQLKGGGAENYRLLKFTVGFSNIPETVFFYTDQQYTNENRALSESILRYESAQEKINVFDRGLNARDHFDKLTSDKIKFITRLNNEPKLSELRSNKLPKNCETATLKIISDRWVYLYTQHDRRTLHEMRLIVAIKKSDGEKITFVTNIKDLHAKEVTEIYKSRWDIETFFKFIKQHLNFSHLLNRSENGIKAILYVTMIAAILLLHYRKEKGLTGYKIVKQKFAQDIERDIIYKVVILCGGDEQKAKEILYVNSG